MKLLQIPFPGTNQNFVPSGFRYAWCFLATMLFALIITVAVASEFTEAVSRETNRGVEIQVRLAEGLPIHLVYVLLEKSTGDPAKDEALKKKVAAAFVLDKGANFRMLFAELGMKRVRQLNFVRAAELKVYKTMTAGSQVIVAILVTPMEEPVHIPQKAEGMLLSKSIQDFPKIYENDFSKFVLMLNGGVGAFSDIEPWFGGFGDLFNLNNPSAEDPLGTGTSIWAEGYVELGLGGVFQVSDYPLYPYGAVSYLMSGSDGHDIYNSGSWGYGDFEKLYAGLIWDLPGDNSLVNVSAGRQVYQIRDGFLLSKIPVSTSIGERAALYLGPRLTSEFTALAQVKANDFGLDAFLIEPSELSEIATNTKLFGINMKHRFSHVDAAFTYFYVPESKTVYQSPNGRRLPREGLRTFNPSLAVTDLFGVSGLWVKAEYAFQNHEDYDMSAHAGYIWAGYQAKHWKWQPALSYRWSLFTGDDPGTSTFERFDPLFSGGLGNFLPGIIFSKVYKNSNLITNRATLSVKPTETLEIALDYFHHRADELNNLGGIGPLQTLQSKDIGQESTLTLYHNIGKNFFLQGIASVGIPGEAIKQAVGGSAKTWYTLQTALYIFF